MRLRHLAWRSVRDNLYGQIHYLNESYAGDQYNSNQSKVSSLPTRGAPQPFALASIDSTSVFQKAAEQSTCQGISTFVFGAGSTAIKILSKAVLMHLIVLWCNLYFFVEVEVARWCIIESIGHEGLKFSKSFYTK